MKDILSCRAMGSLCRQQATFHPENSWKWLSEAERWEHLARAEIASHVKEGNVTGRTNPARPDARSETSDTRWETIAAA